jgi:3-isopropylmalate dehydrogenase
MLAGSLGMLPSASLGPQDENGRRRAMYEPVHGTAPDIAGRGVANPLAMIASLGMCLRYSFDMEEAADMVAKAIANVLGQGFRTADIAQDNTRKVGTKEMGAAVLKELQRLAA